MSTTMITPSSHNVPKNIRKFKECFPNSTASSQLIEIMKSLEPEYMYAPADLEAPDGGSSSGNRTPSPRVRRDSAGPFEAKRKGLKKR